MFFMYVCNDFPLLYRHGSKIPIKLIGGRFMKMNELIERYENAKEIHTLMRRKKMSKREIIFDWLVALFTPLCGIVDEADAISDLGTYYLVVGDSCNKLVRVQGQDIQEEILTVDCNKKLFVVNGNKFYKVGKIYGK